MEEEIINNNETSILNTPFNSKEFLNPESLLVNTITTRFANASWYEDMTKIEILLAGLGGIGSWTALLLSRLSVYRLILYDYDVVNTVNLAGQLYNKEQAKNNKSKVEATAFILKSFSSFYNIYSFNYSYSTNSLKENIMICGFDNMEARITFFSNWKQKQKQTQDLNIRKNLLFIDGRMTAEEFQIFCISGDDDYNINRYETEFLFSSAEAESATCSYKQTSYMASMIASFITNLVVNFVNNKNSNNLERDLPFYINYSAENFLLIKEH